MIVPYDFAKLRNFKPRDPEELLYILLKDPAYLVNLNETAGGNAWLICRSEDNRTAAIVACVEDAEENCSLHMLADKTLSSLFNKEIYRDFLAIVNYAAMLYKRVWVTVDSSSPENIKFVERGGFKKEGIMKKGKFNGNDYVLYSIT